MMSQNDNIDAIKARHAAALPGPYTWGGNTDQHSVDLQTRLPGQGIVEILGTRAQDRTEGDREVAEMVKYTLEGDPAEALTLAREYADFDEAEHLDALTTDDIYDEGAGEYTPEFRELLQEVMTHRWMYDADGEVRTDQRLYVTRKDEDDNFAHLTLAEDQVVYTVARNQGLPADTPREHHAVYRADVCDLRNPTADFLAHSWADVQTLLDEVTELEREVTALRADRDRMLSEIPILRLTTGDSWKYLDLQSPGLMYAYDTEHSDLRATIKNDWSYLDLMLQEYPGKPELARTAWIDGKHEFADLVTLVRKQWPQLAAALDLKPGEENKTD